MGEGGGTTGAVDREREEVGGEPKGRREKIWEEHYREMS